MECKNLAASLSNLVVWKCPLCGLIPPGKIYQCPQGHSFCEVCIVNEKTCPKCGVKIFGSKHGFYGIQNLLAEFLLNQLKFECRWKNHGCKALLVRSQISAHEHDCIFGPINLCNRFSGAVLCKFRTHMYASPEIDKILKHVQTSHWRWFMQKGQEFGSACQIYMDKELLETVENQTTSYIIPSFVEVVHFTDEFFPQPSSGLFLFLRKVEVGSKRNVCLSWAFVWLTSEVKDSQFTVAMKMTVKGEPRTSISTQVENDCVPEISWTLKPIKAPEFVEWKLNRNHELEFPFSIPLSHINKHYVDSAGIFTVTFMFVKE